VTIPPGYAIRPARETELPALQDIEDRASEVWEAAAGQSAAVYGATPLAALDLCRAEGTLWVATDEDDRPVGFLAAGDLDGALFIHELNVEPEHQKRGLGTALLLVAIDHARWRFHPAVALTTDRHISFNAPFYARHGFVALRPADLSPGLKAKLAREAERGLDPARRVAMAKRL
jgi:GNAT superfamily N-acetyltransferase